MNNPVIGKLYYRLLQLFEGNIHYFYDAETQRHTFVVLNTLLYKMKRNELWRVYEDFSDYDHLFLISWDILEEYQNSDVVLDIGAVWKEAQIVSAPVTMRTLDVRETKVSFPYLIPADYSADYKLQQHSNITTDYMAA